MSRAADVPRAPQRGRAARPSTGGGDRLRLSDLTAMVLALAGCVAFVDPVHLGGAHLLAGALVIMGWLVALHAAGGYRPEQLASGGEEVRRLACAAALTTAVCAVAYCVNRAPVVRLWVVAVLPLGLLLMAGARCVLRRSARARVRAAGARRTLVVATSGSATDLATVMSRLPGCAVVGACIGAADAGPAVADADLPVLGSVREAARIAAGQDVEVVAVGSGALDPAEFHQLRWDLREIGCALVVVPAVGGVARSRLRLVPAGDRSLVWVTPGRSSRLARGLKRALDITVGSVLLLLAAPVLAATACAIKATSSGPVLFRQRRLGVHGDEFTIVKFRSMYVGAEERRAHLLELNEQDGGGILFKIRDDPRVTPVGRWIRRFSIDELPQLIHVVSGRMSLVGPRPLAAVDSTYTGPATRRLLVRPGLTGLWQVSGRSNTSWDEAVALDLYYVENWSLALDLCVLARTVTAVLRRNGAY